jgi:hypothetical protein
MNWIKKGLIFKPNHDFDWLQDRAIAPVCELISDDLLRIYFSSRDLKGRSTPIYLDTNPECPEQIISVCGDPILKFGPQGSFDDNGILVSSIVNTGTDKYLYYVGWNPRVNVSYHLSIGLAISSNGSPFNKISHGPTLDRSFNEPFFNTAPFVMKDKTSWKMWYVSCIGWKTINNCPEPLYNVKYATSEDGINWQRKGKVAIATNIAQDEAVGKPFVYIENEIYKMIYSYRYSVDYRTDPAKSYRLGYAESQDGENWTRMDDKVGISLSKEGWDSIMMEYASSYEFNGKRYLIYNGNGFGESGFGYAVLSNE